MTHPIDLAIQGLEERVASHGAPAENTAGWFLLRAYSTGLTLLKSIQAQGLQDDPVAADSFRKDLRTSVVTTVAAVAAVSADAGVEVAPPPV